MYNYFALFSNDYIFINIKLIGTFFLIKEILINYDYIYFPYYILLFFNFIIKLFLNNLIIKLFIK